MKRLSALAMCAAVLIVLAGCGGEKSAEGPSNADKDKSPDKKAPVDPRPKNNGNDTEVTTTDSEPTAGEPIEKIGTVEGLGEGLSKTVPKSKFIGSLGRALFQGAAGADTGEHEGEAPKDNEDGKDGKE